MKKILLSAALLVACTAVSAQKLTYVPWTENALLTGATVSSNGRYVAGPDTEGRAFIYDAQEKQYKTFFSEHLGNEEYGSTANADIRAVTNDGVGYGYVDEKAAKFDYATGEFTYLLPESVEDMSISQYVAPDGSFNCGATYDASYAQKAYIQIGDEITYLPTPTDEWLGYESNGFSARGASADGSVIFGSVIDKFATYPLVAWVRNSDGKTYSFVQLSKRFFDGSDEMDGVQPNDMFEGYAISENGKWIAVNYHKKTTSRSDDTGVLVYRYNVETDQVDTLVCPDVSVDTYYYASSISNEGTIVGYVEDQLSHGRKAFICKAGEKEAKYLSDVYPTVTELKDMDLKDLNAATAITPDGRYIQGFGYVDFDEEKLCYATWLLDTEQDETSVEGVETENAPAKVVASYSLDGKRINRQSASKSVVLDKLSNGKVRKSVK